MAKGDPTSGSSSSNISSGDPSAMSRFGNRMGMMGSGMQNGMNNNPFANGGVPNNNPNAAFNKFGNGTIDPTQGLLAQIMQRLAGRQLNTSQPVGAAKFSPSTNMPINQNAGGSPINPSDQSGMLQKYITNGNLFGGYQ